MTVRAMRSPSTTTRAPPSALAGISTRWPGPATIRMRWGPTRPTIGEVKIVFRNEPSVRSGMLRAGEAQLVTLVTPEDAKQLPATFIEQTGESVGIKSTRC